MDEAYRETNALLADIGSRIQDEYHQAAAEMQEKLIEYQNSFKEKNIKKLEQLRNGEITADEYEYWYKGQVLIGQRWIDMRDALAEDMTHSNEIAMSIISDYIPEAYAINHNYGTFQIEKQSRLNTSYTLYSRETVERLIRENPALLPEPRVDIPKDFRYNQKIVTSAVLQGILQGEDVYQIARRLRPEMAAKATMEYFGVSTSEALERKLNIAALRNARTMVTSAQNGGRIDAYRRAESMGIKTLKVWLATPDGSVRDSHARLDGEEKEPEEEFSNGCRYPGDPNGDPAEVYNCFLPNTKIASDSEIVRSYKHKYKGKIISIKTASGVEFSCTPNHPILTLNGWTAAESLNNGDNILVTFGSGNEISRRNPNINHTFPSLDTIHKSFNEFGSKRTCALGVNFHGDIPTSDVEIITQKRLLRGNQNSSRRNGVNKFLLKRSDKSFMSQCTFMEHFRGILKTSFCDIRSVSQLFSFFFGRLGHPEIHSLRPIALFNSGGMQPLHNNTSGYTELFSDCIDGFTGLICSDNIISIDVSSGSSHVYNLQTKNGYYFVNSIIPQKKRKSNNIFAIAHNCRCTLISQVKGTPKIDLSDPNRRLDGLKRDYVGGKNMTYQDWKDYHSDDPEVRKAAREKWKESEESKERRKRRTSRME